MTTNKISLGGADKSRAPYRIKNDDDGDYVRFTMGSWEIHELFEDPEWVEIFHCCKKYNPIGDRVEYAYQLPDDTECPGCGSTQPDEIQALAAMHNMDKPSRRWGKTLIEQIKEDYERMYEQMMNKISLRGGKL